MRTGIQSFDPQADSALEAEGRDRPRILVVDDERGPRESLRMILSASYEVQTAEDGASALEWLRTEPVDLVTIDLKMPGMKGDELMRAIRSEFPQIEIIVITGCRSLETAVEGIRHGVFDYLSKPFDVVQVSASVERALARRQSRMRMIDFLEGLGRVLGRQRDTAVVLEELEASSLAQERLRSVLSELVVHPDADETREAEPRATRFLEILAETIESRDLYMRGHARRVSFYAGLLADRLCLGRAEREQVRIAGFLHDIGKVGAPSDVLSGELLAESDRMDSIRSHTEIGERLLRPLGLGTPIAHVVRHHHERFDGAGYPDGLAGQDIPLASRIVAVADAFDAMTCERPYRPARTREQAIAELRAEAGAQFDPELVQLFCGLIQSGAEPPLDAAEEPDPTGCESSESLELADLGAA